MDTVKKICLSLVIIGGINWGLVGLLDFNLVEAIFGIDTLLTNIIYDIVGVSALVSVSILFNKFVH